MKIKKTPLEGLIELEPKVFHDERGYFFESYREEVLLGSGIDVMLLQENISFSLKGVIRGLHLQHMPHAQVKLIRAVSGKILDVVVDLRPDSKTYGKVHTAILDSAINNMMFVPEGFAHGFAALEDTYVQYKTNSYYHKESEGGIRWDDPDLGIDWVTENPIISEKDMALPSFEEFTSHFS